MRTQKNIVDYFPHDAGASDGDTLTIIEGLFGNDGYAFWFKLLEKLARSENHFLDVNHNSKWELFCSKAHTTCEKAITIIDKLVELEALDKTLWEKGIIWSDNLMKNIAPVYKNRRREIPLKPVITCSKDLITSRKEITTSKKALTTSQSRVEYSRVDNSNIVDLPEWLNKDTWNAFLEMRKRIKKPLTDYAAGLAIKKLQTFKDAGDDPHEILNNSIMNSWQGLFPLDKKTPAKPKQFVGDDGWPK